MGLRALDVAPSPNAQAHDSTVPSVSVLPSMKVQTRLTQVNVYAAVGGVLGGDAPTSYFCAAAPLQGASASPIPSTDGEPEMAMHLPLMPLSSPAAV